MSSLPKGERMCTKLGELLLTEEKKYDNVYLRGELALRWLGGVCFRGSLILSFSLVLPLFVPLVGFAVFPSSR
jgi:hypothetical protein